MLTRI